MPAENPAEVVRQHLLASAEAQRGAVVVAEATAAAAACMVEALRAGHKVLLCGNGGSAADAQHFAGEMVGRFQLAGRAPLPVLAITTDTTVLTCIANDFAYEDVFSRQVAAFAQPGDVVLGISTSGRSANVLRALEAARARGAATLALTGGAGGPVAAAADVAIAVPGTETTRIQECHITVIHAICDLIERAIGVPGARQA
ncbi:MAG: D-sedoheptulose-7-phosphate isomerase [Thermomicrobiales bacterium]